MALSINEILKSAKIAGMELSKVKTEGGGSYFLAEFRGEEKSIMVDKLSDLTRAQWVDELLYFAQLVEEQQAPAEQTDNGPVAAEGAEAADDESLREMLALAEAAPRRYRRLDPNARYFWVELSESKRREGSAARAYEDWMIANAGATTEEIKAAGHDLKHLRWDIKQGWVIAE